MNITLGAVLVTGLASGSLLMTVGAVHALIATQSALTAKAPMARDLREMVRFIMVELQVRIRAGGGWLRLVMVSGKAGQGQLTMTSTKLLVLRGPVTRVVTR